MLITRVFSGIILLVFLVLSVQAGGFLFLLPLMGLSIGGVTELYRLIKIDKTVLSLWGYCSTMVLFAFLGAGWLGAEEVILVVAFIILMSLYIANFGKHSIMDVIFAFFGFIYVSVMFAYLYKLRVLEGGKYFIWLLFIGAWGCDTCAYCVGKLLGKHKLAPVLSPKKSVEGSVGGIFGAVLLGLLYAKIVENRLPVQGNIYMVCFLNSLAVSIVSQLGDLTASAIKRTYGVKDYGKLIPGHGGILDRFDSILFAAPVTYFLILFFL